MPWFSSRPPGFSSGDQLRHVGVDVRRADVLDHADRGDRVERLAGDLAVVHDADVDLVGDARRRGALARQRGLRLAQRDPGDVDAVLAGGVDARTRPSRSRRPAPARPARSASFVQTSSSLVRCASSSVVRAARPDRARVRHRLVEEEREVLVGEVVVVRDRALVAQDRVALALAGAAPSPARFGTVRSAPALTAACAISSLARVVDRRRRPRGDQRRAPRRCRRRRSRRSRRRGRGRAGRARAARGRAPQAR